MRNRLNAALFALAATLACGTIAGAADKPTSRPARDPEKVFKRLDADHDGLVSKSEFAAVAERRAKSGKGGKSGKAGAEAGDRLFAKLDADKDGFLSPEEFARLKDVRREAGATTRPAAKAGRRGRAKA